MFIVALRLSLLTGPAPGTGKRSGMSQDRPATDGACRHLFSKHSSNHRSTSGCAARSGAGAGPAADHLECFCSGLNGFEDNSLADFIAQADRAVGVDDRLLAGSSNLVGQCQLAKLRDAYLLLFPDDKRGGERWGQRDLTDSCAACLFEPAFHFAERIASSTFGGKEHDEGKDCADGWMG